MAKSPDSKLDFAAFCGSFEECGLVVLGGLVLEEALCPPGLRQYANQQALLVGNQGNGMWYHFSRSNEYSDGEANPLDSWTLRRIDELTRGVDCKVFHPSIKPYWPFQQIAQRVTGIKASPLGILIHPEFGLWHGLRGLLVFDEAHEFVSQIKGMSSGVKKLIHPCNSCPEKPCLNACPVQAFANDTLDVELCFRHLDSSNEPDCMSIGCRARDACPVGSAHRNDPEQIAFNMRAYRG